VLLKEAAAKQAGTQPPFGDVKEHEPLHVHVEHDDNIAKFWLDPVRLKNSGGFSRTEINRVQGIVNQNRED
jgi:Domain of unknown function (DUF4160)